MSALLRLDDKYKLQVVVIERPYDTYASSQFTMKYMSEIFKLKFEGYCSKYPYGIMPVSDYDFMATHISLAIVQNNELVPISAFKSITSEDCSLFRVTFPVINHKFGMYKENFLEYVDAIQSWQSRHDQANEIYAYNASWTMKTDLPKDLRDKVREASLALFYHYYQTRKIQHVINSTSANFNINKHQEMMGLHYLKDKNEITLDAFKSPVFFEEPFYIMYLDKSGFSELFSKKCEAYEELWNSRLIINSETLKRKSA